MKNLSLKMLVVAFAIQGSINAVPTLEQAARQWNNGEVTLEVAQVVAHRGGRTDDAAKQLVSDQMARQASEILESAALEQSKVEAAQQAKLAEAQKQADAQLKRAAAAQQAELRAHQARQAEAHKHAQLAEARRQEAARADQLRIERAQLEADKAFARSVESSSNSGQNQCSPFASNPQFNDLRAVRMAQVEAELNAARTKKAQIIKDLTSVRANDQQAAANEGMLDAEAQVERVLAQSFAASSPFANGRLQNARETVRSAAGLAVSGVQSGAKSVANGAVFAGKGVVNTTSKTAKLAWTHKKKTVAGLAVVAVAAAAYKNPAKAKEFVNNAGSWLAQVTTGASNYAANTRLANYAKNLFVRVAPAAVAAAVVAEAPVALESAVDAVVDQVPAQVAAASAAFDVARVAVPAVNS